MGAFDDLYASSGSGGQAAPSATSVRAGGHFDDLYAQAPAAQPAPDSQPTAPAPLPAGHFDDLYEAAAPQPIMQPPPIEQEDKSSLTKVLETIDAPANAVRGTLDAIANDEDIAKQAWEGITRKKTFALGDTLARAGVLTDSPNARAVLGFIGDIATDPLNLVGVGGLTKAGEAASAASKAARSIRLAPELATPLVLKTAAAAKELAPSLAEQALQGQRALLSFAGVPVIKGASVFRGVGRIGQVIAKSEKAQAIAQWSNRVFLTDLFASQAVKDANSLRWMGKNEYLAKAARIKAEAEGDRAILDRVAAQLGVDVSERNPHLANLWEKRMLDESLAARKDLEEAFAHGKMTEAEFAEQSKQLLHPEEHAVLSKYAKRADEMLAEAERAGIDVSRLSNEELNYMAHIMTSDAMKHIGKAYPGNDFTEKVGAFVNELKKDPGFTKRRVFDMAATEANAKAVELGLVPEGVKLFHDDPVFAQAARELAQAKAVTDRGTLQKIGRLFGVEVVDGKVPAGYSIVEKGPYKIGLPNDVAQFHSEMTRALVPKNTASFIRSVYMPVQNWWAGWALSARPAFHVRNAISNMFLNYLGGVYNPAHYLRAGMLQLTSDAEKLTAMSIGKTGLNGAEIKDLAERFGVLKGGQYAGGVRGLEEELTGMAAKSAEGPMGTAKRIAAALPLGPGATAKNNVLMKLGGMTGEFVEQNARLAHFISKLEEGMHPLDAAMSVKKYLFNYNELSDVERNVFKRIMPFYSFTRFNIPVQVKALLKTPEKIGRVQQLRQEIEAANGPNVPEALLPKWVRDSLAIKFGRDPKNPAIQSLSTLASYLPVTDLQKLMSPADIGAAIVSMVSPNIKMPVELTSNTDLFRTMNRRELVRVDKGHDVDMLGGRISPTAAYFMRAMIMVNEIDRWNPGNVFGQGPSPEHPEGVPASVNLLPWTETARTRLRQDTEGPSANLQGAIEYGTGLKLNPVDLRMEAVARAGAFKRELARLKSEENVLARRADKQGIEQIRGEIQKLTAQHQSYMALARKYGVMGQEEL